MRDMRDSRASRAGVREERLRVTAGFREQPALSSWRGRSGRRYVVGVHALNDDELGDCPDAVVIAVQRTGDGSAELVGVELSCPTDGRRAPVSWLSRMRARGATEMHVHRLAESDVARAAVLADLADRSS